MICSKVERGSALPSDRNSINLSAGEATFNLFADFGLFNDAEQACTLCKVEIRDRIQIGLDSNTKIRSAPLQVSFKHIIGFIIKY